MTDEEIIDMWNSVIKYAPSEVRIAEFAKLVAAKEREACAKLCESEWGKGYRDDGNDAWLTHDNAVHACAAVIRARTGEQA
jgi:hypothetical protein